MAKTSPKPTKSGKPAPQEAEHPKKTAYKSFRLSKRIKGDKLPGSFGLFKDSLAVLGRSWKIFLGIVLIYGALNAILAQGFSAAGNLNEAKAQLDGFFQGNLGQLASSLALFSQLVGSSGNATSSATGAYQLVLILAASLALIWTLRQVYAGHAVRVRDSFYRGMTPLVPFVLVLVVILLQLIPMAIGMWLYGAIVGSGLAVTVVEQIIWAIFAFSLTVISLWLISSSIFALYIVTLPDMTPMKALRSARELIADRRWALMRKILFLPLVLIVGTLVLILPVILFATPLAAWVFFVLTTLLLPVAHSYLYALYRSMV